MNKQIQIEKQMSDCYLYLSLHCRNTSKALKVLGKVFWKSYNEERLHAELISECLLLRGGKYIPRDILKPTVRKFSLFQTRLATLVYPQHIVYLKETLQYPLRFLKKTLQEKLKDFFQKNMTNKRCLQKFLEKNLLFLKFD